MESTMEHRILIAGGPRTGKTTLADKLAELLGLNDLGLHALHTDSLVNSHSWSDASAEVARWLSDVHAPWIIEGVAVPRAIRKWLAANPTGKPADWIVWLDQPWVALSTGQAAMGKGCATVWAEVEPELLRRGVELRRASDFVAQQETGT